MKRMLSGFAIISALLLSLFSLAGCLGGDKEAEAPKLLLSITTFENPESVVFDNAREQVFVSQANFAVPEGGGKIAQLSASGVIKELAFVDGLNHPKGMGIHGDKLYVADVTELVEIEIPTAKIIRKYPVSGSLFLNDVTIASDGTVYVSDTLTNKIHSLKQGGEIEEFISDVKLNNPNGLYAKGDKLFVGAWGTADGTTVEALTKAKPNGRLLSIDTATKEITVLSPADVGHLDGVEDDGNGNFYVSDWIKGNLYHISEKGELLQTFDMAKVLSIKSAQGFADIVYNAKTQQIWAPMMLNGSVLVLSVAEPRGSY